MRTPAEETMQTEEAKESMGQEPLAFVKADNHEAAFSLVGASGSCEETTRPVSTVPWKRRSIR